MATLDELIQEARSLGLDRAAVVAAFRRVIAHNERYRARPSRRAKQTDYDILLAETQPALALACLCSSWMGTRTMATLRRPATGKSSRARVQGDRDRPEEAMHEPDTARSWPGAQNSSSPPRVEERPFATRRRKRSHHHVSALSLTHFS